MAQLTPSQARIIDPILTTVAQGFQQPSLIGSALFPVAPVGQRAGKIVSFGKESFQLYDTQRAPGSRVARINVGYSSGTYGIVDHALAATVPQELMEEAEAVPNINLASSAVMTVQDAMRLRLEYEQGYLATQTSNYAAGNYVTKSGTGQWSDITSGVSDPINDIETGKEVVRTKTGKRPNTVVIGASVWKSLKQHPKIIDRVKYTGRDVPTLDLLASLFDVQRVVLGDAIYSTDAGTFVDIWGKNVIVAYTDTAPVADMGRPSFGYTYQLRGYPYVSVPRYDADTKSWIYDVTDACKSVIASNISGYLISAAVV